MARQPPSYLSCAKCGYRGICKPEDHECNRLIAGVDGPSSTMHRGAPPFGTPIVERIAHELRVAGVAVASRNMDIVLDEHGDVVVSDPGEPQAARLSRDISQMLDRSVCVTYLRLSGTHEGIGAYNLHQRCDACREVITTPNVRGDRTYFATGVIVARAVRLAWLKHRCKPIGGDLANIETEDLRELYEQLEVESMRLAERAIAVRAVLDARLAEGRG